MFAKRGNSRNRLTAKQLCYYALFTVLCLIFGYIESFLPFFSVAPGIKLGLSNALAVLLIYTGDIKGAFFVNIARILLSSLLFSNIVSLIFSLTAGVLSLTLACLIFKFKQISAVGVSIACAALHNTVQIFIACFIYGTSVLFYLPVLLAGAVICGGLCGLLCNIILKKVKTNGIF